MAQDDERIAILLRQHHAFRHSMYFALQAMEKYLRSVVVPIIDLRDSEVRDAFFSHSIEKVIKQFLLQNYIFDDLTLNSISEQLETFMYIEGVEFSSLHNTLRYPFWSRGYYCKLDFLEIDADLLIDKLGFLKKFIVGIEQQLATKKRG